MRLFAAIRFSPAVEEALWAAVGDLRCRGAGTFTRRENLHLTLAFIGETDRLVKLVVLETIAANLGSMATPIGNPQNLYLYSISGLTLGEFALAVLPYAGLSLVLLMAAVIAGRDEPLMDLEIREKKKKTGKEIIKEIFPFLMLLILCLLVVFHVLNYIPVLLLVIVVIGVVNKRLYLEVDYFLLLTFLFFFIFVGNMKRIPQISELLMELVAGRELMTGVLASQVISNVPAAVFMLGCGFAGVGLTILFFVAVKPVTVGFWNLCKAAVSGIKRKFVKEG